jgi:hypothetical protein
MRMTRFLVMVTALAAAPAPAPAASAPKPPSVPHWVMVGHHVDGGPVEVDTRSITPWGDLTRGWWRLTLAQPRPDGTAIEKHLEAVDCTRGFSTSLEQVTLRPDGGVIDHTREAPSAAINRLGPATPGTTGAMAGAAICRLRPPPPRPRHHR